MVHQSLDRGSTVIFHTLDTLNLTLRCHSLSSGPVFKMPKVNTVQETIQSTAEFVNELEGVRLSDEDIAALENFYQAKKKQNDPRTIKNDLVIVKR